MQNGKLLFLMHICAFYFLICSTETYSQTLELFKEGETTIAEVKFKGLDQYEDREKKKIEIPLYESDFRSHLDYEKVLIFKKEKYASKQVEQAIKSIKERLYNIGYLDANVIAFGEKIADDRARIVFSIERGNLIPVSEIHIVGNKNVTSDEIVKTMKDCLEDSWKNFYKARYEYCTHKNIRQLMSSKGYFLAQTSLKNERISNNIAVTIEVNEGIRYRIGEIKIDGATSISNRHILGMFRQKQGDIIDGINLLDFLYEKLKNEYGNKGYLQYDAELDPEYINPKIEGQDGIVNLKIIIDEGKQFRIRRISIVCDEPLKIQKIKKMLGLNEGEIFNQEKFENGITRINKTKEFKFVDKDRDVEMRSGDGIATVDLIIKINKK